MKEEFSNQLSFIDEFRDQIFNNRVMLSYRGEISQEIILALLEMTKKKLEYTNTDLGIKSKIYNVMVGCLQNITFHTEKNEYSKSSMFSISRTEDGYKVYSGNAIKNEKSSELRTRLDKISKMTEKELNEFYMFYIQTRELSDKKGIGLGLIDIARKTGNDLYYDFEKIDEDYSYFALRTFVKSVE